MMECLCALEKAMMLGHWLFLASSRCFLVEDLCRDGFARIHVCLEMTKCAANS